MVRPHDGDFQDDELTPTEYDIICPEKGCVNTLQRVCVTREISPVVAGYALWATSVVIGYFPTYTRREATIECINCGWSTRMALDIETVARKKEK